MIFQIILFVLFLIMAFVAKRIKMGACYRRKQRNRKTRS